MSEISLVSSARKYNNLAPRRHCTYCQVITNSACGRWFHPVCPPRIARSWPFLNQIFHVLGLTSGDLGRTPTVLYFILLSTLSRMPWSVTKNIVFTFWHITFYTFYVILGTETSCELEGQAKYLHSTYNGRKLFTTFNIMPNFCSSLNNCFLVLFVNSLSLIYNRHG